MANNRDTFVSEIYVNNEQANDAIAEMTKQLTKLTDKYDDLVAKNEKLTEKTDKAKAAIDATRKSMEGLAKDSDAYVKASEKLKKQEKAYNDLNRQLEVNRHKTEEARKEKEAMEKSLERATEGVKKYSDAIKDLSGKSMENLKRMQGQLKTELDKTKPNTKEWNELADKYAQVTSRIKALEQAQQDMVVKQGGLFKRMADGLSYYYGAITLAVGAIRRGVAAFSNTYKTISNFEQANANLSTILGVTRDQMKDLEDAALKLGSTTRYTASEVTNLQTELAKLGFTQKEILDMEPSVLNFATSVGTDLASAASMAGVALRSFGLTSEETEDALGTMAAACNKSALSFAYLQNAFSTIAPVAKTYGLSLKDTIALLGTLANAGFDASSAATATRNILLNLADTNGKLAQALGGTVNSFDDIMDAMIKLRSQGVDLNQTLELTDKRSVSAFNTFLDGAESAKELRGALEDVNGELQRTADVRADTVEGAIAGLQSAWEGFILSFRNSSGTVKDMLKTVTDIVRKLPQYSDGIAKVTKSVLAVVLAVKAWTLAEKAKNAVVATGNKLSAAVSVVTNAVRLAYFRVTGQTIKAAAAQAALNTAMAANPFGAVIAVIGALTAAIGLLVDRQRDAAETTDYLAEAEKNANEEYGEQAGRIKALTSIIENNNISLAERKKALDELKKIVPGYHGDLTEEGRLINSNKEAIDEYCKSLREKIRLEARKDQLVEIEKQIAALEDQKADAQERQHQALVESGGDTKEKGWGKRSWFTGKLEFTPYGQAVQDENDIQDQIDALEKQAQKISDRIGKVFTDPVEKAISEVESKYEGLFAEIENEFVGRPAEGAQRMGELQDQKDKEIAAIRQKHAEQRTVETEETITTNAVLTQAQFDYLSERYDKLTKKEKAMVDAEYANLSAEESKALKSRYDKLIDADNKSANQRYQNSVKLLEKEQREAENAAMRESKTAEELEERKRKISAEYLQKRIDLAKQHHQDTSQLEQQQLAEEIKEKQRIYESGLNLLKASQKKEEMELKAQRAAGELSQKEYEDRLLEIKSDYILKRMQLAGQAGQDETAIMQEWLDMQVEAVKAAEEKIDKLKEDAKKVISGLNPSDARNTELEEQLKQLDVLHNAKLLSEEQFREAVRKANKQFDDEELQARLSNVQKYTEQVNSIMQEASNFVNALKEAESAQLEAQYQADLTAAGDNAEKREQIEADYEQKKLDLQKKYADVDMAINIAKTVANGAAAVVKALADPGGVAGTILAVTIGATTAAEVATIIAQRNAIKSASVNSSSSSSSPDSSSNVNTGTRMITGYSKGGNTEKSASDSTPVGIVHANEWVAPAWLVRKEPVIFANLEQYRKSGRPTNVNFAKGFAEGGFAGNNQMLGASNNPSLTKADIEDAMEAALVKAMDEGKLYAIVQYGDILIAGKKHENFLKMTKR